MAIDLLLLHTSDAHVPTFNALRDKIAPNKKIEHVVRRDWLARAASEGLTLQLKREIDIFVNGSDVPVLCTCSTLGETAEASGAFRIDRPMMQAAAASDGPVLLVCALGSTVEPSQQVLQESLESRGNTSPIIPLVLEQFWPLFEAGDTAGFHAAIAAGVIEAINARSDLGSVVLAQVSMAPAAHLLDGAGVPVHASPQTALSAALGL